MVDMKTNQIGMPCFTLVQVDFHQHQPQYQEQRQQTMRSNQMNAKYIQE